MLCLTDVRVAVLKILEIIAIPFSPPTLTSGIGITKTQLRQYSIVGIIEKKNLSLWCIIMAPNSLPISLQTICYFVGL
jgi:hypothetical protein